MIQPSQVIDLLSFIRLYGYGVIRLCGSYNQSLHTSVKP